MYITKHVYKGITLKIDDNKVIIPFRDMGLGIEGIVYVFKSIKDLKKFDNESDYIEVIL